MEEPVSLWRRGRRAGARGVTEGWSRAASKAVVLLLLSFIAFALVPDRLVSYLSLHVQPRTRDAIVTLWWLAALGVLVRVFVLLQRARGR